jgi:hypothetical protein
MDVIFKDTDSKVFIVGANIYVQCRKCGNRFSFRYVEGEQAENWNFCIRCAKDALKGITTGEVHNVSK